MKKLLIGVTLASVGLAGCQSTQTGYWSVHQDAPLKVGHFESLHEDCTSLGDIFVTVTRAPAHGSVYTKVATDYPTFLASNPRASCNKRASPSTQLWYKPDPGYVGDDSFAVRVQFPQGDERNNNYPIKVK